MTAHPLQTLLVDADAPEHRLEDLTEGEGEEADGAELQALGHLLQDDRRLRLDFIHGNTRLSGNLKENNNASLGEKNKIKFNQSTQFYHINMED